MAEYSRLAKGSFSSTGQSQIINLPFQPDYVRMVNQTVANTNATSQNIASAFWDVQMGQGTAVIEGYNSTALIYDYVATGGISTFSGGLSQQFGTVYTVSSIATGTTTKITTSAPNGYAVGQTIVMSGLAVGGTNNSQLLNGVPFTITTINSTTQFTINWNSSNGVYATTTGTVRQVLYPFLYLPEDNVISGITTTSGSNQITVTTTMYHNLEIGQEVAFRIPSLWGSTQLNSLPNNLIPGSPMYGYVTAITGTINGVVLDNWNVAITVPSNVLPITAFNPNFTLPNSTISGLSYAQLVPVGDVNTGGKSITTNTLLYPPPSFPLPNNSVGTINGPAIKGAFVNNTSQGFIIGAGAGRVLTTGVLVGASSNIIYWEATLHDYVMP